MMSCITALAIGVLALSWPTSASVKPLLRTHRVLVSNATVMASNRIKTFLESQGAFPHAKSSELCRQVSWCQLWCRGESDAQLYVSDMIVTPGYTEGNMDDALICYTFRNRDIATHVSISGVQDTGDGRVVGNLVDGIHPQRNVLDCFFMRKMDYPWFLIDLGALRTFSVVKIVVQPSGSRGVLERMDKIEVRTGTVPVATPGDFASYRLFGRFGGVTVSFRQEIDIEVPRPVTARFISVQKMAIVERFQACHIEVY